MKNSGFYKDFKTKTELDIYDANALGVYALQLYLHKDNVPNIDDAVVDGNEDKGIDIVYIDRDLKIAIVAQVYEAETNSKKKQAPGNKATQLTNGLHFLLNQPIQEVPEILKPSAEELREAIKNNGIDTLHIWYVHNLPNSKNIEKAMKGVELAVYNFLPNNQVKIQCKEFGADTLEKFYTDLEVTIRVNETFKVKYRGGFIENGTDWDAFVATIPARWVYDRFQEYKTDLFSANVRNYLGIINTDKNINKGIQETVNKDPQHFWVFNNGITILTHEYKLEDKTKQLTIEGLSILNGAQTVGSIGNLERPPANTAQVQARFVMCKNKETIENIKQYNNSQNSIKLSDYRSNDDIQTRLVTEFSEITDVTYSPRRGGSGNSASRGINTLTSEQAGQYLAAFSGKPHIAYHKKAAIWQETTLYRKIFQEATAEHIFLVYALFETIRRKKSKLSKKYKNEQLMRNEENQHHFFATRGSIYLLMAAIAESIEIILDSKVPNPMRLKFSKKITFEEAIKVWEPIVDSACYLSENLMKGFSEGAIREEPAKEAIKEFSNLLGATKHSNESVFKEFSDQLIA